MNCCGSSKSCHVTVSFQYGMLKIMEVLATCGMYIRAVPVLLVLGAPLPAPRPLPGPPLPLPAPALLLLSLGGRGPLSRSLSWSSPHRDQSLSSSLRSESVSDALDCSELVPEGQNTEIFTWVQSRAPMSYHSVL